MPFDVYFQNQPEIAEETGGPHPPVSIRAPPMGKRHLQVQERTLPSLPVWPQDGHTTFLRASASLSPDAVEIFHPPHRYREDQTK